MILGVGGGLGAGYILWEFESHRTRGCDARLPAAVAVPGPLGDRDRRTARAARRGARDRRREGRAAALDAQLERGLPAIVWIDTSGSGSAASRLGAAASAARHSWSRPRRGRVPDRRSSAVRETVTAAAGGGPRRVGSYSTGLSRSTQRIDLDEERLRAAVLEGLRLQVEHLSATSASSRCRRGASGRACSPTPATPRLAARLRQRPGIASLRASIYTGAAGGAHLRTLYADFLDEAADLLGQPALRGAATAWRSAATAWRRSSTRRCHRATSSAP